MSSLGERIVDYLAMYGAPVEDDELASALAVARPVLVEACRQLEADGRVTRSAGRGRRKVYALPGEAERPEAAAADADGSAGPDGARRPPLPPAPPAEVDQTPQARFAAHARRVLSARWGTGLQRRQASLPGGERRACELVSGNGRIVGDVVWLEGWADRPEIKSAAIAEAVLVIGHMAVADRRFLVFGQDRDALSRWLARYRSLLDDVEIWFLEDDRLERLA